jgi:hypothetical protein
MAVNALTKGENRDMMLGAKNAARDNIDSAAIHRQAAFIRSILPVPKHDP